MQNFERPGTLAVYHQEEYILPRAEERLLEFRKTQKPTELWFDRWSSLSAKYRNTEMSFEEREIAISKVLSTCGVDENFQSRVKMIKTDNRRTLLSPDEIAPEDLRLPFIGIFTWLGDFGSGYRDQGYINDFTVGIGIDAPDGLLVVKFKNEEPDEDSDYTEQHLQIAMYPATVDPREIFWEPWQYNP